MLFSPFFHSFFFFGGLSIHLSQALLAHLFSYNITWGATKKEVERSNFFIEVPRILRRFWLAFVLSFGAFLAIAIMSTELVPVGWRVAGVADWSIILPLAYVERFASRCLSADLPCTSQHRSWKPHSVPGTCASTGHSLVSFSYAVSSLFLRSYSTRG